jgi:hypothetical protein
MNRFFLTIISITITLVSLLFFNIDNVKAWSYSTDVIENWTYDSDCLFEASSENARCEGSKSLANMVHAYEPFYTNVDDPYSLIDIDSIDYRYQTDDGQAFFDFSSEFSISFWAKSLSSESSEARLDVWFDNASGGRINFRWANKNYTNDIVPTYSDLTVENIVNNVPTSLVDDVWTFYTWTFSSDGINIYFDDILKYNADWVESSVDFSDLEKIWIHSENGIFQFSDLTIFNKALTQEELALYIANPEPIVDTDFSLSDDYIMYYSENPKYVELTQTTNLKYVYNVCDSFTNYDTLVVKLYDEFDTLIETKALTYNDYNQCSGTDTIQFTAGIKQNTDNYYINISNMDADYSFNTSNFMISEYESIESFELTFIEPSFNAFQVFNINDTATTTQLTFGYNFCETSYFNTAIEPQIFLYNETSNTKTNISTDTLTSCGGITSLDFPLATGLIEPQTFSPSLYDNNDNTLLYNEDKYLFQISFYDTTPVFEYDTSTSTLFNIDTHDLVCSETQWNSSNILTTSYCNILQKSLYIPLQGLNWVETKISKLYFDIKNIPPFRYIYQLKDLWEDSEPQLGINKLFGIKEVKAIGNINDNITIPETGDGFNFSIPFTETENIEFSLFNETEMRNTLGNTTINLIQIFGHLMIFSLLFIYIFYTIKNRII